MLTKHRFWSKGLLFSLFIFVSSSSFAGVELVCKGQQPRSNRQPVEIDCNDRQAVLDILLVSERNIKKFKPQWEGLCWEAYKSAKEVHPSMSMAGYASAFFEQCNHALKEM